MISFDFNKKKDNKKNESEETYKKENVSSENLHKLFTRTNTPYEILESVKIDKENGQTYLVTEFVHWGAGVWSEEKSVKLISYEQVQQFAEKEGSSEALKYKEISADNWEEICFPARKLQVKESDHGIEIAWILKGTTHRVKLYKRTEWYELSHDYFIDGRWYSKIGGNGKLLIRQEDIATTKSFLTKYKKYVEDEAALTYLESFLVRNPIVKPDNYVEWNYKDEKYGNVPFYAKIEIDGTGGWFVDWGCKSFPNKNWEGIGGMFGRGASIKLNKEEFLSLVCDFAKYGSTKKDFVPLWDYLVKKRKK